jgi:hypothetical protein
MPLTKTLRTRLTNALKDTRSPATVKEYLSVLERLNPDQKQIRSLAKYRTKKMVQHIKDKYAITTQKTILATLLAVLKASGRDIDKRAVKRLTREFELIFEEVKKVAKNRKSAKQTDNWLEWKDILSRRDKLEEQALGKDSDYFDAQDWLLLTLYTAIAPRRVKDYQLMYVVPTMKKADDKDRNYYVVDEKKFVFNNYKTKKIYGEKVIELKDCPYMLTVLDYLIDAYPAELKHKDGFPLMVQERNMNPIKNSNWVTRRLNKILKKNVSVSMLRHIYLTDKYGDDEVIKNRSIDAMNMGHCLAQQQDYILKD